MKTRLPAGRGAGPTESNGGHSGRRTSRRGSHESAPGRSRSWGRSEEDRSWSRVSGWAAGLAIDPAPVTRTAFLPLYHSEPRKSLVRQRAAASHQVASLLGPKPPPRRTSTVVEGRSRPRATRRPGGTGRRKWASDVRRLQGCRRLLENLREPSLL